MNKSAVFRLKLSFPNVSGLALHQCRYSLRVNLFALLSNPCVNDKSILLSKMRCMDYYLLFQEKTEITPIQQP